MAGDWDGGDVGMAENSKIEWTDHTFNPWMGCTKVSPACANCYAERDFDHRYKKVEWGPNGTRVMTSDANWLKPLSWNRTAESLGVRYRVFCASLADVFEDWKGPIADTRGLLGHVFDDGDWGFGPDGSDGTNAYRGGSNVSMLTMEDIRVRLFGLIDATPNLDWLLLTKRPENIRRMWPGGHRENVWLGCSVENQEFAEKRIVPLLTYRDLSPVLFLSCEPLVGPVNLLRVVGKLGAYPIWHDVLKREYGDGTDGNRLAELRSGIDWVITGGESGPNARPADPDWFRSLRDQCISADVPFLFKQWGEFDERQVRVGKKTAGRLLDGRDWTQFPLPEFHEGFIRDGE